TLQLNPDSDFYSDASEFSALMAQCTRHIHPNLEDCPECMERLKQAAALYQGDLLKNLSIPDSLPFEEWLVLGRERLRLQMIDALGHIAAGGERSGNDEAAMQYARRRLILDPWNEDAYRALMRVLARRGQRTAALAEFERCKRVLAEGLGIGPSAETARLAEQIRGETGREVVPSTGPLLASRHLPQPLTPLIGREKETGALLDLLRRDGVRLVTLLGSPGIGKTRLAMHVAGALKGDYGGNVFFVPLAGAGNPALVMQKVAQIMGLCEGGCLSPFDLLAATLKDWKVMLVLDAFEQVQEAGPLLLELLQSCPMMKILVTGRAPLRLRGEQRFILHPLALADPDCVPGPNLLVDCPAVRLFVDRAQAVMPKFMLNSKNAAAVLEICTRLDGVPLAIELAAASIRLMPPQALLERLSGSSGSALQLLKGSMRDGGAHHQTLRQAFQDSYDLLDGEAQALFARLGVFAGSTTLEAADAVCNVGDIQARSVDGIAALLDNCLVQQDEGSDDEYRFRMLGTLREFALEQLAGRGELDVMRQRHADYFLTFARLTEPELTGADQMVWLDRVDKDLDNL
ncbi:MAG TPA: BTAD domain-containing putative transcriptional regulator, partial [Polyangia bacterium]